MFPALIQCILLFFLFSEGRSATNIIDPMYEGKIRAKVAEAFPFMKDENVDAHYKMIEKVLEDDTMVCSKCYLLFCYLTY